MNVVLYIISALTCFVGLSILFTANGAIHEIEGLLFLLMGVIEFTSAAIIGAIKSSNR